ncbi:amino acid adenylation domain-containing protein, partial [Micromonospora aurantiaca (nom. illeg.)]|uniref:amino acid adenylation domain-containing protein n=2 Tax=Micromonospora TaxID=1873 RepID=UPI0033F20817
MSSSPRSEIPRVSRDGPLPLSYGQQQMWFINRLDPGSTEYNVPLCLRLRGALDTPALQRAWAWTVARHEVLRTRYTVVDGAPTQVVDPPDDVGLALDDLRGLPPGERRERVDALLAGEVAVAFDLEVEWPVRARLLRLTDDEYVLSIVFHHICWDAWSLGVLGADLNAAYRALTEGGPMPPELPVQYADYAAWQRTEMSGPVLERHLRYWRAQLDGNLPVDLPADRPRPAVRSHTGAAAPFVVPAGLARRLDDIGQRLGTTPFVVMLTAFAVLVARYTGRSDVAIGTVVSDRNRPELENLIGYGINTLVVRAVWDGSMSFENLIQRMRTTVLDAYDHQAVPFARLVDELAPDRDLARTPLFQVAYTSHTSPDRLVRLPGIRMEQYGDGEAVAKWDLELQTCQAEDGSVHSRLVYPTALFDDATMARMARHLLRLLERVADDPAAPAAGHDLLDEAERALVLGVAVDSGPSDGDGNRVGGVAIDPRCVPEVFEDQAAATPDAVAVRCGDSELSYAEVNVRANRVAHLLRARGVGAESLVAVLLDRGVDLVPVLLGVLKAGAGYLPLDPANPTRRLRHAIADSGAALVVTCVDLRETARLCHDGALIVLDASREAETLAAQPVDNPASVVAPDGVMYVIYTSGSTGQPKGVCVTHANVDRLLRTAREHLAYGPADVWTLFHSYAFDVSVFEMWGALLSGGTLVVVPQGVTRSPDDLLDLLVDRRVTVLSQTPSAFRALVAAAETGDPRVDRLSLRVIVFAGEKLDVPSLRPWAARVGLNRTALINMYGITETTVHATYHRVTPADFDPVVGSPIGRPLADLTIRLLDDEGRPVPIGVPGEIYVGGPGLARGYLRRPGLTAARFLPDPFGAPGSRRYRSGDLARRLPDGQLRFLRRADDQAKIRGYRVEPGEIRAVLLAHPAVRDAAVIVDEVSPGEHRLIAYVVPAVPDLAEGDLGAHCGSLLPPYMVPAAIVPLPAIPLTANGKLDRGKLPVPDRSALVGTVRYLAPRSSAEERMAEVWRAVLRVDRVGVLDSFFDLGGDSIRAVALVGQLRTAGFDVSVRDVFERRTVARLCELADARPAAEGAIVAVEPFALITPADRRRLPADLVDAYPMGQTQLGMVADMLAHRRLSNYHNVASIRIRDGWPLSADALRAAAQILVGRHEVLRTSFDLHSCSVPMQLVHADADLPVRIRDLRGLNAAGIHRQMEQFHADERTCPFDLACPPMMRLTAHVTDDGWWLSITEFHAIVEGWSYHSLIRELFDCYEAIRAGRQPASEPVPAVRYADVVASELRALSSPEDRAYWRRVVESVEPFSLPSGWGGTGPSESYWVHVPFGDLEPGLRRLAAAAGASLKSVVVAAYGAVLGRLTYRNEFSAGLVTHTRPEAAGAERVYGMHLNTVPFVFERGRWTWRELVAAVFAQEVAMWPHRHFPMPQMQRLAGGRRIVNVLLNFVNFDDLEPDSPALDLASTMTPGTTEFDLAVTTVGRRISLKSHTRVLGRGRAERLAAMYRGVLEAMAADPDG